MGFNNWHWHEEVQFTLVLEGEMVTTAQGRDYYLHSGDGFFINSNLSHMTRPTTPESARYLSVNVHPSLLTLFHGSVVEQKYFLPYVDHPYFQMIPLTPETPWQERTLGRLRFLFQILQEKPFGYELEAYSYLLHIWKTLLDHLEANSSQHAFVEKAEAQEILSFLRENYEDGITLESVSEHVHLSRSECCHLFKSTYGCSIFTYLMDYRLQQSILFLTDSSLSISQISERVGFNSTSYYIKCFREKVGVSPLQYRNASKVCAQFTYDTDAPER